MFYVHDINCEITISLRYKAKLRANRICRMESRVTGRAVMVLVQLESRGRWMAEPAQSSNECNSLQGINVHQILIRIDKPLAKIGPTHHDTHHRRGNPHGRFHALTSKAFIKFQFSNHLRQRANWKWFFSNYTISLFSSGAESQPGFGTRLFMCDTIVGLRGPLCFVNCRANGIWRTRWHFVRSSPA